MVKSIVLLGTCALSMIAWPQAGDADRVTNQILAKVRVDEVHACAIVKVSFNFPVRYSDHFPFGYGDEVRVRFRPLNVSEDDLGSLDKRETLASPRSARAAIGKITYEGDNPAGPTLAIFFRHPVAFKVGQGSDFRSLIIAVSGPEPMASCVPG